jgi:hypothetical protein
MPNYFIKMFDAADVPGVDTTQLVGFRIEEEDTRRMLEDALIEYAVFDDAGLTIPSVIATLGNVQEGTILAGEGTNALKIRTSKKGNFLCHLTSSTDEKLWLACSPTFGCPDVNCQAIDTVEFK